MLPQYWVMAVGRLSHCTMWSQGKAASKMSAVNVLPGKRACVWMVTVEQLASVAWMTHFPEDSCCHTAVSSSPCDTVTSTSECWHDVRDVDLADRELIQRTWAVIWENWCPKITSASLKGARPESPRWDVLNRLLCFISTFLSGWIWSKVQGAGHKWHNLAWITKSLSLENLVAFSKIYKF